MGGGKLCHGCMTHQLVTYSNYSKVLYNVGGSHVDKATSDGWSYVMSSNEGGTSYAYKLPFNSPKP
jgi:hypothetical protein